MANLIFQFVEFAGQVLLGLVKVGICLFFANLVANKVRESKAVQDSIMAMLTRVAILVLAGAMALQQIDLVKILFCWHLVFRRAVWLSLLQLHLILEAGTLLLNNFATGRES